MENKVYIAYGSNLNLEQMKYRCPDAEVIGTAMLEDYELEFRGVATIVPKEGSAVPVLLWKISPQDEINLNQYEGFPRLYRQEEHEIDLNGQKISGMAYVMNGGQAASPGFNYYHIIAEGYRENNLDKRFLEFAYYKSVAEENGLDIVSEEKSETLQMNLT